MQVAGSYFIRRSTYRLHCLRMWRVTASVGLLFSMLPHAVVSKCTGSTIADLKECLSGNTEALTCFPETGGSMETILECLESHTVDTSGSFATVEDDTNTHDFSSLEGWFASQTWNYFKSDIAHVNPSGAKNVYLSYVTARCSGTKGAMLVVPGNGESCYNYDETMKHFCDTGYSPIYCYTHRGMGSSDRMLDDHFKLHVEDADDFVKDIRTMVGIVTDDLAASDEDKDKPFFLFCHSLGCAVSLTYLMEEYEHAKPQVFNAVVAQAPLIQADTDPFPYDIALAIGEAMVFFGQGREYAPTRDKPFEEWYKVSDCKEGSVDRCTRRVQRCIDLRNAKFGNDLHTGLCLGGVTGNFASALFDLYADTFVGFMAQEGKKIVPPLLLQQSGPPDGTDKLVVNAPQDEFCQNSCKDCTMLKHPEAIHNLAKEKDTILFEFWVEVDKFYQSHKDTVLEQEDMPAVYKADGEPCNDDLECGSRICDPYYAFDIFGGKCRNRAGVVEEVTPCNPEPYDCYSCGWGYPCSQGYKVEPYEYCGWWCYTYYHCVGLPGCFRLDDNGDCIAE